MTIMNENVLVVKDGSAITSNIVALVSGLLFGIGLTVSTMVDPARVIAFLDIFGKWDPTLAFVMLGGISVYVPVYWMFVKPKNRTILGGSLHLPTKTGVDKSLILGAVIFGIGWGISGICPGPGMTNMTSGDFTIYAYLVSMLIGMIGASKLSEKLG
jgi:uncharacterized membrane protein YedE/YeeE